MRDKIFYLACFGFLLGVFAASLVLFNIYRVLLVGLVALGFLVFFALISKNNIGISISILILLFCLGVARFYVVNQPPPEVFEDKVGQKISLAGRISDEPKIGQNSQQLVVSIALGDAKTDVLLFAGLDNHYAYGGEINFTGRLDKPENFTTDQGKGFDYVNYLRKDGILYVENYPKIDVISAGHGNFLKRGLFALKEKFLAKLNQAIPPPESLLMGGLILGERSDFGEALRQSFINTGTIHIVALSGYNVTIVSDWFIKIFAFLPISFATGAGILAILLFVLMTGGTTTAIRAGIMAALALVARVTGRNYDVGRALVLAVAGMVFLNPFILVFDISFELSVLATVAVIFVTPKIEKYFYFLPKSFGLREVASVTTAAYIFVSPFILYKMGNLSLVALPANVLILPFIPITMLVGFITGLAGMFSYALSAPLGLAAYLILHYELGVVSFFSDLPLAAVNLAYFPWYLTLLLYIIFIYYLFGRSILRFFAWREPDFIHAA